MLNVSIVVADWYHSDWLYRVQISSDPSKISSTEADIPLFVDLSNMPTEFFDSVKLDGADIVVTADDEVTVLEHEVVFLDKVNKTGELHVKIPLLDNVSSTDLYIYYGNPAASDSSTPNVWNDYRAVWHLNESIVGFDSTGIGVATINAMDGGDGGWAVLFGDDPIVTKINLAIDEDQISDGERAHTTEQVAYWIFKKATAFDIENSVGTIIGEGGIISDLGTTPTTQNLRNTYIDPVIITVPNLENESDFPAVTRISSVTTNNFEAYIQNPGDSDVPESRDVYYLVFESGAHTLPGGVLMEAGKESIAGQNRKSNFGSGEMEQITPLNTYTKPVVLGQVMTTNDPLWSVFWTSNGNSGNPPTAANIYVGMHIGEDGVTTRVTEDVGYVIVEESTGTTNSVDWEAKLGADSVQGVDNDPPYSYVFSGGALLGPFNDSTINSFNASAKGNVSAGLVGKIGRAINLDGNVGTRLAIGGLAYNTVNGLDELTASFWLKTTDNNRSGILDFDRSEHWQLGMNFHNAGGQQGRISFDTANSPENIRDMNSSSTVNDGDWHHIVAVFDVNEVFDKKIYIDGVLNNQLNQHNFALGKATTRYGFIGDGSEANVADGSANNLPYEGMIDEVRIKHSADSADLISTIYNNESDNAAFWTFGNEVEFNNAPNSPETPFVNSVNSQAGQTNPTDLTIGGIDSRSIFFSAIYDDDDLGDIANRARIQVSTDPDFNSITHWDSGFAFITDVSEGNRSSDIEYDNFGAAATLPLVMDDGNEIYYWRIAFSDDSNAEGEFSPTQMFTLLDIPNDPAGVSVLKNDASPDTFTVNWLDTSVNEEEFEVQVDENDGGGFDGFTDITSSPVAANSTMITHTDTVDNRAYLYRVRACNYAGCSGYVDDSLTHYTEPEAPDNVYGDYDSDTQFTVNYTGRSVLGFVDIEHCIGHANCDSEIFNLIADNKASTKDVAETEVDTTGIVADEAFRWRVRATNAAEDVLSEYTTSPYEFTTPDSPSDITAVYVTDNFIELSWNDESSYEDGFRVWVSENGSPFTEITPGVNTVDMDSESYMFTNAAEDSSYQFRVFAHIGATLNNSELFSANADSGIVKSSPAVPTNLVSVYNADDDFGLDWDDNADFEDAYEVLVSENNGIFSFVSSLASDSASFNYTSGALNSSYKFVVDAVINASPPENPDKLSSRSNETDPVLFTTPAAPVLSKEGVTNSTIDWGIIDNANFEKGFIFYDSDGVSEIVRFEVPDLNAWTETALDPNTEYTRYAASFLDNSGDELISDLSNVVTVYTLANAPENIQIVEDGEFTTISWEDGGNPIGTEFRAENLTEGGSSGWSTDLLWVTAAPICDETHQFLVKSRNFDGVETFAEIVEITGEEACPEPLGGGNGGGGGGGGGIGIFETSQFEDLNIQTGDEAQENVVILDDVESPRPLEDCKESPFSDVSSHSSKTYVDGLYCFAVINGRSGDVFAPDAEINRVEYLKMLLLTFGYELKGVEFQPIFLDVDAEDWFAIYVMKAYQEGFVQGYPDGSFRPDDKINNAEALKMFLKFAGYEVKDSTDGPWYNSYVFKARELGILFGEFEPGEMLLRSGAAKMLWRILFEDVLKWDVITIDPL